MWNGSHRVQFSEAVEKLLAEDEILRGVLGQFEEHCTLPHGSGNEELIAKHLKTFFDNINSESYIDDANNLICTIPASAGCEGAPLTILQGHSDMVCAVAEGSGFNPLEDAVSLRIRKNEVDHYVLTSDGRSSLGADCGIGNAGILWLLSQKDVKHGPLKVIFTANEEIGLVGAHELDPGIFEDAQFVVNVDGFKCGRIVAGSAGGRRATYSRAAQMISMEELVKLEALGKLEMLEAQEKQEELDQAGKFEKMSAYRIQLKDFTGGHSGYDINKGRANPVKLLAQLIDDMTKKGVIAGLADFDGGLRHNVIPAQAAATVVASATQQVSLEESLKNKAAAIASAFGQTDPAGRLEFARVELPEAVLDPADAEAFIGFLCDLKCGPQYFLEDMPGVTDTSINIGRGALKLVKPGSPEGRQTEIPEDPKPALLSIQLFERSMSPAYHEELVDHEKNTAKKYKFDLIECSEYEPWVFKKSNPLLDIAGECFRKAGAETEIAVLHVGLEPSVFSKMNPELSMICIGATVSDPHSVHERVDLMTIKTYAQALRGIVEAIAGM